METIVCRSWRAINMPTELAIKKCCYLGRQLQAIMTTSSFVPISGPISYCQYGRRSYEGAGCFHSKLSL